MLNVKFSPQELQDTLGPMDEGMNSGIAPMLLSKRQLALVVNGTMRGTYAKPRPPYQIRNLSTAGKALVAEALAQGPFQGAAFYNPDSGDETLIAAIAGRLLQFHVLDTPVGVDEITVPGDPNPAWPLQAWLWQSEKWLIWNDGMSLPVFFDGANSVRSNWNSPVNFTILTATTVFVVPAINTLVSGVEVSSDADVEVGDILTVQDIGTFLVQTVPGGNLIDIVNLTAQVGKTVPIGTVVSFTHIGSQLPPARMGAYGMGRNALSLTDAKSFVFSDLVGGGSGTQAEGFRDAVLYITENNFLAGGGVFSVPGSVGDIRAMIFAATLNTALGQGPLHILTHSHDFTCQVPLDRLTWQDVTNPILTQSLIGNGALGQNSTLNANSDILFRAIDGIRSEILATREFDTWGNVPQSREVDSLLMQDSPDLLRFGSAINWDNRLLMTARPVLPDPQVGIYNQALVALNFDPLSSLRGKAPSIYDGIWTGLNVFQLVTGEFRETPRAFAFTYNTDLEVLEIYELLKSQFTAKDNGTRDITMEIHSASIFNAPGGNPLERQLKRLLDGEIYVDQIPAGVTANFQAFYRPDSFPCWIPWFSWSECAGTKPETEPDPLLRKPQFRPQMGFGEPSPVPCDPTNNRPLREGYTFQFRLIFSNCRFLGAKFRAITIPDPEFSKRVCNQLCPPTV